MPSYDESTILRALENMRNEAEWARSSRIDQNRMNFDMFNLKQNFDHKTAGQSQEFLPKQSMAVEQLANFMQQGLIEMNEWWKVEGNPGVPINKMAVRPAEIQKLITRHLEQMDFISVVEDAIKSGALGALIIAKVHGEYVERPTYRAETKLEGSSFVRRVVKETDLAWKLKIELVRQENFFPDPTGADNYVLEDIYIDFWEIERLSKGKNAIYDSSVVEQLKKSQSDEGQEEQTHKARETGHDITNSSYRNRIKVTEIWGNILDPSTGELLYENVVCTIANDKFVLHPPKPYPFWHGQRPYIVAPLIRGAGGSVWHKALMDAPSHLNTVINELTNLIIDGGLFAVHGIKQLRPSWLSNPNQVSDGIAPGTTLQINDMAPAGAKVLENVFTSTIPPDALQVLNLVNQEMNQAALTNDLRMGVQPYRQSSATAIVEQSQAITGMFTGIVKRLEQGFFTKVLEKSWATICQHINDLDQAWLDDMVGPTRSKEIRAMSNADLFAGSVAGVKFMVFGVSAMLNRQRDFTKLQAFLQTIASSPVLLEEFVRKYSFTKLLKEIMRSLDIDAYKLEMTKEEMISEMIESMEKQNTQAPAQPTEAPQQPNMQSQIPQAGSARSQEAEPVQSAIPRAEFPGSPATKGQ